MDGKNYFFCVARKSMNSFMEKSKNTNKQKQKNNNNNNKMQLQWPDNRIWWFGPKQWNTEK